MLANGRATALFAESFLLPVLAQGRATALLGFLAESFPLPVLAALILKLPPCFQTVELPHCFELTTTSSNGSVLEMFNAIKSSSSFDLPETITPQTYKPLCCPLAV